MPEHDLDPVSAFVAALVVLDGLAARFSVRDAVPYTLVFQRISEPVSTIAPVGKLPFGFRQAVQQDGRTGVVAGTRSQS